MVEGMRELLRQFRRQYCHGRLLSKSSNLSFSSIVNCERRGNKQSCGLTEQVVSYHERQEVSSCLPEHVSPSPWSKRDTRRRSGESRQQLQRGIHSVATERCAQASHIFLKSVGAPAVSHLSSTGIGHRGFAVSSGDRNLWPLSERSGGDRMPMRNSGGYERRPPTSNSLGGRELPLSPSRSGNSETTSPSLHRHGPPVSPPQRPLQPSPSRGEEDPNKKMVPVLDSRRINEAISAQYVRLVTPEGHKVLSRREALAEARKAGLDLVEMDGSSAPPVCKLLDYNKFKFQKRKKEKENKQKLVEKRRSDVVKEVRISSRTESRDLEMKADSAMKLLNKGYRVKFGVIVKRNDAPSIPEGLLATLVDLVKEVGKVEWGPKVSGHRMDLLVRPLAKPSAKIKKKREGRTKEEESGAEMGAMEDEEAESGDEDEDEVEEAEGGKREGEEAEEEEETKRELAGEEEGEDGGEERKSEGEGEKSVPVEALGFQEDTAVTTDGKKLVVEEESARVGASRSSVGRGLLPGSKERENVLQWKGERW